MSRICLVHLKSGKIAEKKSYYSVDCKKDPHVLSLLIFSSVR